MSVRQIALWSLRVLSVATLLVVMQPLAASAQHSWDMKAKIGVGIPVGDLADFNDPGVSVALGLTRWLAPRYGLHFGGAWNALGGAESPVPGVTYPSVDLWHYNFGLEFGILHPETSKARWHGNVGIGGTTAQPDGGGSSTDFTVNAGTNLEYRVSTNFGILAGVDAYFIMSDPTGIVVPVQAGFRYFFSE